MSSLLSSGIKSGISGCSSSSPSVNMFGWWLEFSIWSRELSLISAASFDESISAMFSTDCEELSESICSNSVLSVRLSFKSLSKVLAETTETLEIHKIVINIMDIKTNLCLNAIFVFTSPIS